MTQEHEEHYRPDPHADEELVPFDVQGYSGKKGIWLLALIVAALLALMFFLFKTYQPGVRDRGDAPKIIADNTPYKIEPENPGGDVAPNQDMEVYDVMNGTANNGEVNITESAEQPIDRPSGVNIDIQDRTETTSPTTDIPSPEPVVTARVQTPSTSATSDSRYVIQLASLRSRADAEDAWANIQRKHGSLLPSGAYADIKRAEVQNKGTFYRLRLAGLSGKDSANRVCNQLKARQQACFMTTK